MTYMDMEKTNAVTPKTASGSPNVGLFVGFNLPVHHKKYQAGVCEAEERAIADAKLYEAQRDEAFSEIQDFMVQAKVQENVLSLLARQHRAAHPRKPSSWREATTPRPTSTMRRSSRPCERCSRSSSRSPR